MFTIKEITHLRDALEMAKKSNERMKASKPLYAPMFDGIALELSTISDKLRQLAVDTDKNTKNK